MAGKKKKATSKRNSQNGNGKDEEAGASSLKTTASTTFPTIRPTTTPSKGNNTLSSSSQTYQYNHYQKRLEIETLVEDYVWVIPNFFTPQECQEWVAFAEPHWEYTQQRATRYMAHRECYRYAQTEAWSTAIQLYQRLLETTAISKLLTRQFIMDANDTEFTANAGCCNPNIRLYRYDKGMSFGKHVDGSNVIHVAPENLVDDSTLAGDNNSTKQQQSSSATKNKNKTTTMMTTRFTMLIYLSECQGGATRFVPPPDNPTNNTTTKRQAQQSVAFEPQIGALLLHLHGDDCLEHEADPVLGGVKYVFRSDLAAAV